MQLIESIKSGVQSFARKALGLNNLSVVQSSYQIQSFNQIYPSWYSYKVIKAYKTIDIIYSVVQKLAKASAAIPLYGYDQEGEDLPETDKLVIFLRSLTLIKRIEMYTWLYMRGECFMYKEKTLGLNGKVDKIHFINPSFVTLVLTDVFPEEITGYVINDYSRGITEKFVQADEMIFIKKFNPDDNYQLSWRGISDIDILKHRITRMESNMANSVAQMQNGGVPGVMYWKDLPNNTQSKVVVDAAKDNFARFIKNSDNKGAPFIQAGDMGYFPIGSTLVDLNSLKLEQMDLKAVCNVFGISARLFNEDGTGSEISDDNAQEGLYTNAVIPMVQMVEDAFNTELVNDFGVGYRIIKHDFSGIWVLQRMLKDKIATLAASPVFIPNDVLEAMGYERNENPLMDIPLIKSGYVPIDQFEPLPSIEQE